MEKLLFSLIFIYSIIIPPIFPTHSESTVKFIHGYRDSDEWGRPMVIENTKADLLKAVSEHQRARRDVSSPIRNTNENAKNITTKVNTQKEVRFDLLSVAMGWSRNWCVIPFKSTCPQRLLTWISRLFGGCTEKNLFCVVGCLTDHKEMDKKSLGVWKKSERKHRKKRRHEKS